MKGRIINLIFKLIIIKLIVNNYPSVEDNNYLNNGNNFNQNFITNNYPQNNDDKDISNSFKLL